MSLTSTEKNQEILSLALEDRSAGYQDLVSNANALLSIMQRDGNWKSYSGPIIRERLLYAQTGNITWYNGFGYLPNSPGEIINDAEFRPKMCAVGISLANEDILNNSGEAQLLDIMETHIAGAELELNDEIDTSIHSDGTRFGGLELGGLKLAVPTTPSSGTYGSISRVNNAIWRTTTYDANSAFTGITAITSTTVRPVFNAIMTARSRNKRGPNLLLASSQHYAAYDAATVAIQRINDETSLGKLGFQSLKYFGAGRSAEIVQDGGIGSNMPSDTTYFLDTQSLNMRYHPERNFNKIGKTMMPINQDAAVQYIGFMGELTMTNPLFNAKMYDSSP